MENYTIQSGDSLWKITKEYYNNTLSESEIAQKVDELSIFNNIENPANISTGSTIDLSCFDTEDKINTTEKEERKTENETTNETFSNEYTIQSGDSLWKITKEYYNNTLSESEIAQKVDELSIFNNIENPANISTGSTIDLSCFDTEDKINTTEKEESKTENENESYYTDSMHKNDTEKVSFKSNGLDDYEYKSEELKKYAQALYEKSQNNAISNERPRTAPSLDENGKVITNQEFYESDTEGMLSGLTVMVNAGHGGYDPNGNNYDPGAVNETYGAEEWSINLEWAEDLTEELLNNGADVLLTQGQYKTLSDCVDEFAEEYGKDNNKNLRLISLHCNSGSSSAEGIVYFNSDGNNELIESLNQAAEEMELEINGTSQKNTNICQSANENNIQNALVEIGFISNPQELDKILNDNNFKQSFVNSIVKGLEYSL